MKKIINKVLVLMIVAQVATGSFSTVFAQSYDDMGGFSDNTSVNNGSYDYGFYENANPNYGASYDNVSNYTYPDASTYYGNQTCVGCGSSVNTGSYDYGYYENANPNYGASYDNVSNYTYPDGSTHYGNQTCVGCGYTNPSYTTPAYTSPSYTSPTYTSPTYTSPTYTNYPNMPGYSNTGYTAPGYSNVGYSTPGYSTVGYTNPGFSVSPSYTTSQTGSVVTTIICPNGSHLVSGQCVSTVNGTVITTTTCPNGTVLNGNNCINTVSGTVVTHINCPNGTNLVNGQCINNVTGQVVTNINCPTGTNLVNGQCVNNVNGQVVTNYNCPNGTILQNGQCINTITPPVTTVTNCPSNTTFVNGTCQQIINPPVVTYQTCWDGSVIPATQMCAPQFKVCSNGTSIPVNQVCYVAPNPRPIEPIVIKFNNVVTNPVTQITQTSGRCNGIGLIANNAQSTGWFEYGETSNLGRTTASAQIGSSYSAPFSNVLANLKPTTRYYCRAIMQNQYGVVKGEIVSFVTKSTVTRYVQPVVRPVVTKIPTTTKVPVKKPEILCADGTKVKVSNQSSATLINDGQKLIALQIEKLDGKIVSGGTIRYKINFKNLSDTRITNVLIKVTLPAELTLMSANIGNYDPATRTLTLNQDGIDPYTEGSILLTGTIIKDAPLGKTIVTNVYALYTVPGTQTQDEVTAYVVGSVVPQTDISNVETGAKKVVGATSSSVKGFLPNSLIEWLALFAILFIIFILGRSIYASYKEDDRRKSH